MGITSDLFYDKKTDESNPDRLHEVGVRRGKAGCGQTNRCLQPPYNTPEKPYECDQYPPVSASTKQSAFTLPINRCVPADQYSSESDHNITNPILRFDADSTHYRGAADPRSILQVGGRLQERWASRAHRSVQDRFPGLPIPPILSKAQL